VDSVGRAWNNPPAVLPRRPSARRREPSPRLARPAGLAGLLLGALAGACSQEPPPARPDVLVVLIDTMRSDHMSLYGHGVETTPEIDRIAAQGVVFENAVSHVPQTLPSTSSLLSGLYPSEHGVRVNGIFALPDEVETLAERLGGAGYDTAGIVSSFTLDPRHGTSQGFGHFDADFSGSVLTRERRATPFQGRQHLDFEQRADEATDKALAWLGARERSAAPFFLFVHYFDPHFPYAPPADVGLEGYDGEVRLVDREVGRLVRAVEARAGEGGLLLVIAGDHGELFDPNLPGSRHAGWLEEGVLRVPLVLRHPSLPAGLRVEPLVGLVDVAPTILELARVPGPAVSGESLLGSLEGVRRRNVVQPIETYFWRLEQRSRGPLRVGMRTRTHKYVLNIASDGERERRIEELFDVTDGEDGENLLAGGSPPPALARLVRQLRASTQRYLDTEPGGERLELDQETRDKLESLGYFGGGSEGARDR